MKFKAFSLDMNTNSSNNASFESNLLLLNTVLLPLTLLSLLLISL